MPWHYRLFPERRLVHSLAIGTLTGDDLIAHATSLGADTGFDPGFTQLADFRPVSALHLRASDIRRVAEVNPFGRQALRVLLVQSDLAFGMARMYQILLDENGEGIRITRSADEAWQLLRLDPRSPERELIEASCRAAGES
jgi:hypothetical protein